MADKKNPYIEQENYFEGYNESIERNKNNADTVEFDKLCFEVFMNTDLGKRLMTIMVDTYLMKSFAYPNDSSYQTKAVYFEGYRDCVRTFKNAATNYKQRKDAEQHHVNIAREAKADNK